MKPRFALVIAMFGTLASACSEPVEPESRLAVGAAAVSFEEMQRGDVLGPVAGMLGDWTFNNVLTRALTSAAPLADGRNVVLPNAYADVMGEGNNVFPFSFPNTRYQQIFLGAELGALRSLSGLCLRGDEIFGWGPGSTMQLAVKLGPTQRDLTTFGPVFDDNYSAPPTTVFSGQASFPANPDVGTPDAFDMCIDFTSRYVHPVGSNFIVEIAVMTTSGGRTPDACDITAGCTTRRLYAFSTTATMGTLEPFRNFGLIMKFISTDPVTKADCKDGGWEGFGFDNQGRCIQFVETEKDSR